MAEPESQPTESQLLRALLAVRDVPCPVCGYNLRTNTSDACPECGAQLDLRVGSLDLKLGPWLTAVIAITLVVGFLGLFLLLYSIPMVLSGFTTAYLLVVAIPLAICGVYVFLLWRLITRRKKFWARSRRAQLIAAAVYTLAGPGLFIGLLGATFFVSLLF